MRRMVLLALALALAAPAAAEVRVDGENFPDAIFREYVSADLDRDHDGVLSDEELAEVTSMDVSRRGIASLKGVEHFGALLDLVCYTNSLTSLNLSGNGALMYLECDDNRLSALDVSGCPDLRWLECELNGLKELDLGGIISLDYMKCYGQTAEGLKVTASGDQYVVELGAYVRSLDKIVSSDVAGYRDVDKEKRIAAADYDAATGRAVFGAFPASVAYSYRTGYVEGGVEVGMDVTLVGVQKTDGGGDKKPHRGGGGCEIGLSGFAALGLALLAAALRRKER